MLISANITFFIPWIHFIERSEITMVYGGNQHLSFATPVISVQTVVCRQKQNKANWIQRLFSIVTIFRNQYSNATFIALFLCLSVRKFQSHPFVIPTKLHTKIQSHCDTVQSSVKTMKNGNSSSFIFVCAALLNLNMLLLEFDLQRKNLYRSISIMHSKQKSTTVTRLWQSELDVILID